MFQSTPPAREATSDINYPKADLKSFNPRLPHGRRPTGNDGNDGLTTGFNPRLPHGRRLTNHRRPPVMRCFNPRLPHGRRPSPEYGITVIAMVSIHASRTGGDPSGDDPFAHPAVSIHASRTGGDDHDTRNNSEDNLFQSTPPAREATRRFRFRRQPRQVSIHASRTGGDPRHSAPRRCCHVSIHASRTGGDPDNHLYRDSRAEFQSTPPAREATR